MIHLGKFEGVLLASDFDDTLVGSDCEVSRGNREALEYFVREGGPCDPLQRRPAL